MNRFYKISEDGAFIFGSGSIVPGGYSTDFSILETKEDGSNYSNYKVKSVEVTVSAIALDESGNPILDADGNKTYIDEVQYEEDGVTPKMKTVYVKDDEAIALIEELEYKKDLKDKILKAIDTTRVEADGLYFDGDEKSQERMLRAVNRLVGDELRMWRLYDNSEVEVNQTTLGKALDMAADKQHQLWFCKSEEDILSVIGTDTVWLEKYKGLKDGRSM